MAEGDQTSDNWPYDPATTRSLAALAVAIGNNPKTRTQALKLMKEVRPTARFPELENEERVAALQKQIDDEKAERAREKIEQEMARKKRRLTRSRDDGGLGLNAEEVKQVEDFMEKNGIVDHEIGAKAFLYGREPADATPASFDEVTHMQLPGDQALLANPDNWARNEAHRAITESMKRGRAA